MVRARSCARSGGVYAVGVAAVLALGAVLNGLGIGGWALLLPLAIAAGITARRNAVLRRYATAWLTGCGVSAALVAGTVLAYIAIH